jgi:hypothetical protein
VKAWHGLTCGESVGRHSHVVVLQNDQTMRDDDTPMGIFLKAATKNLILIPSFTESLTRYDTQQQYAFLLPRIPQVLSKQFGSSSDIIVIV